MHKKHIFSAVLCGALSAAIEFYLIPTFLMRGIPDAIWAVLMLLLPAVVAVLLLRHYSPKCVLWSLLAQIVLVIVFAQPIGGLLGYRLVDFNWDFFDFIAYGLYVFGWSLGVTAVQFIVLLLLKKLRK